jgi:hypothetical protein
MSVKKWNDDPDVWDEILMQMDFQNTLQTTVVIFPIGEYPPKESKSTVKVSR